MGDDLVLIYGRLHTDFATALVQALSTAPAEKYRPLLSLFFAIEISIFGAHFGAYQAVNILIELGNGFLVFAIVRRMTNSNVAVAVATTMAFLICRFSFYNILQVFGQMESLGISFMLVAIYFAVESYQGDSIAPQKWTVVAFVAAIFVDERYLSLYPFVIACAFCHPRALRNRRFAASLALLATFAVVLNVVLKTALLRVHVLVGTGGQNIAIDPTQIEGFLWTALENMLGFNAGPDYMSAKDFGSTGGIGLALGILFALAAIVIVGAYFSQLIQRRSPYGIQITIVGLALFLSLLLSTSITFRQDFRWLYAPFTIVLIAMAAASVSLRTRVMSALCVFACAISVLSAFYYRTFLGNVYFDYSMGVASDIRDAMERAPGVTTTIVDNGDLTYPNWVFGGRHFFELYGLANTPVSFVAKAEDIHGSALGADVLRVQGDHAVALAIPSAATQSVTNTPLANTTPFKGAIFSFAESYQKGTINSDRHVDTPSGHGVFVMDWPSPSGPMRSLTILSTFKYAYRIDVTTNERLGFVIGRPYGVGTPTRALVTVQDGQRHVSIYDAMIQPAAPEGIRWQRILVSLKKFAGRSVVITFEAESPDGDQTAAWIAFGSPAILHS